MKYLIILLVLVSIATVSCKKNSPVEPVENIIIGVEIRDSGEIIHFSGSIDTGNKKTDIEGDTPKDWSVLLTPTSENLTVTVCKNPSQSGTLLLYLRRNDTGEIVRSGQNSEPEGCVILSYP